MRGGANIMHVQSFEQQKIEKKTKLSLDDR
jgi:hypothetical protein